MTCTTAPKKLEPGSASGADKSHGIPLTMNAAFSSDLVRTQPYLADYEARLLVFLFFLVFF